MRKTLFFDFGNVLIYFDKQKIYRQLATVLEVRESSLQQALAATSWEDDYELGKISSMDLYHKLITLTGKKTCFATVAKATTEIFSPNQAIIPILQQLKRLGHQLVILSNTQELHYHFAFVHYPHFHYFDKKVLSYEVGYKKPDPRIYYKALDMAACEKEAAFFIDDLEENIVGAKNIGLQGLQFNQVTQLEEVLLEKGYLQEPTQNFLKIGRAHV